MDRLSTQIETARRVRQLDEMFCPTCGEVIKQAAVLCVHCGVPVPRMMRRTGNQVGSGVSGKSKATAVVLAVFLGFWGWLYTAQRDWGKFIGGLMLSVLGILLFGVAAAHRNPAPIFVGLGLMWASWLWAVLGTSIRSSDYYTHEADWPPMALPY